MPFKSASPELSSGTKNLLFPSEQFLIPEIDALLSFGFSKSVSNVPLRATQRPAVFFYLSQICMPLITFL